MTNRTRWSAQLITVVLCALALKYFYSTTGPDNLRWILGPVTWLTSLLSGRTFSFEAHSGYMSSDHTFLIAASCAGVNFLITSFLLLAVKKLWTNRQTGLNWRFIPVATFFAYVTTLVANTVRICIALELQRHPLQSDWLDANQVHRLEGIIVYFGFLFFLHLMTEGERSSVKYMLLPLAIYYFTTLGLPLMNGAYRRGGEFWEHAAFVVVIPIVLIIPVLLFSASQRLSANVRYALACRDFFKGKHQLDNDMTS